jgi:hypothetical protein
MLSAAVAAVTAARLNQYRIHTDPALTHIGVEICFDGWLPDRLLSRTDGALVDLGATKTRLRVDERPGRLRLSDRPDAVRLRNAIMGPSEGPVPVARMDR